MHSPDRGAVSRIAIVGPESSGKSTLAGALVERLCRGGVAAVAVAEYARDYYADRPYRPTPADVLAIARGQLAAEAQALAGGPQLLICDSTVLTCVIWAEVAFGAADPALTALNRPRDYALTLLARPDIPWQADPLRSHPRSRDALLVRYRRALAAAGVVPVEIAGQGPVRLEAALAALRRTLCWLPKI